MVKKGRPEKLTPRLKEIVAEILKNHPKRKPKVIEEDLRHILLKDEETIKEFKSVDPSEGKTKITFDQWIKEEKLPGYSAIAKLKTKLNRPKERGPLESPWSLASLDTYPIPFEKVPFLLELTDRQKKTGHYLTIRDAKWIGRLSLLKDENKGPQKEDEKEEEYEARVEDYQFNLIITAVNYAAHEKICEKVGLVPVDTSMFDAPTLKETDININLYRYGTNDIELRDGQLFSNGQPLLYAGNELEKKLNRTKKNPEYVSVPNVTENQVGDLVQLKDTKEIVKIIKIENGVYLTEPASLIEQNLWHKMKDKGESNG